jgi:hypothetical protein
MSCQTWWSARVYADPARPSFFPASFLKLLQVCSSANPFRTSTQTAWYKLVRNGRQNMSTNLSNSREGAAVPRKVGTKMKWIEPRLSAESINHLALGIFRHEVFTSSQVEKKGEHQILRSWESRTYSNSALCPLLQLPFTSPIMAHRRDCPRQRPLPAGDRQRWNPFVSHP